MNKKKIIIAFACIVNFVLISAKQREEYYFYTKKQTEANIASGKHNYYGIINFDFDSKLFCIGNANDAGEMIEISAISVGKIYKKGNIIICYDKRLKRNYIFKQKDKYTIEALNSTAVFNIGTKFYLSKMDSKDDSYTAYFNKLDLINSDYWKTGNKNGIWTFINSKQIKLVYYELNIPIDSVFAKDIFMHEINVFVKKYLEKAH